jgi:hypothetical protein
MVRRRLPPAAGLLVAALLACSTALRLEQGADDAGANAGDGGEGGASNESGADADSGSGEASTVPRCTPPCTAFATGAAALTGLRGIVATNDAIVAAHAGGLTWCNDAACSTSTTMSLTGTAAVAIALAAGTQTVLAVSAGNRLFRCPAGIASCQEEYQSTALGGLTAFAAGPTRIFWINGSGELLTSLATGVGASQTWLMPNVANVELAAVASSDTVFVAVPGAHSVFHVISQTTSTKVASQQDVQGPRGVAVTSNDFYIASRDNGRIVRCPKTGCTNTSDASVSSVLATNQDQLLYLATDATHVYWTNEGTGASDGTVSRAPLDGGSPQVFITGLAKPRYIAVNGASVSVSVGPIGGPNDIAYVLK